MKCSRKRLSKWKKYECGRAHTEKWLFLVMDETQYLGLRQKYADYSSWAIWNDEDEADPTIIESHIEELNVNHVFIAYNWSRKQGYFRDGPWANFRGGGSHARKLKYACNDTELRGSYITDLFKGITEPVAAKVRDHLTPERIDKTFLTFLKRC